MGERKPRVTLDRHFPLWGALVIAVLALPGGSSGAPDRARSTGEIYVVSVAGGTPRALARGYDPVVSPDGRLIAYERGGRIWLMRPDGSDQRRLTANGGGHPVWSPSGRRLVYMAWNSDNCYPGSTKCAITDIWTVNVDGSGEQKLLEGALQPVWSPRGRRLLFRRFVGPAEADMGVGALMVAWADGSHVRTLFPGPTYDATRSQPAWSPNGKWIAFDRTPWSDLRPRLYLIRADGSHLHRLTNGTYPAWSPNGKSVAFERDVRVRGTWKTGVWIIALTGKHARRISSPEGSRGRCPTWSPDGKRIAVVATVYRSRPEPQPPKIGTTLSIVRPDGRAPKKLADAEPCVFESSFPSPPSWSHDGRRVYYAG